MLQMISRASAAVARASANRPIHIAIVVSLLALVAYLAVVDEYLPEGFDDISGLKLYHPPGKHSYSKWSPVEDAANYQDADAITIVPLKFRQLENEPIPEIEGAVHGPNGERILVLPSDNLEESLLSLGKLTYGDVTWKVRSHSSISRLWGYARHGIHRLQSLVHGAETFDIGLISAAYVAMVYTIGKVFVDMKRNGSNFWLALSTIVSLAFAFVIALAITSKLMNTRVSLLSLTEGIPFLTAVVGFKHKISVANTVMKQSTGPSDAKTIVSSAVGSHSVSLLRDHVVVIGVLVSAALYAQNMTGLRNFCILASMILFFDLIFQYTFFSAMLALKVEINRARRTEELKSALEEEGVDSLLAASIANKSKDVRKGEDSVAPLGMSILSLKAAIIGAFFALHGFWLGSSWLHDSNLADLVSLALPLQLSKSAAKYVPIGAKGTVVTVLAPRVYVPYGFLYIVEEYFLRAVSIVSESIKDSIISKFLLFGFAISITSNAYFLNAARYQRKATNKLIEKEISRPKLVETLLTNFRSNSSADSTDTALSGEGQLTFSAPKKMRPISECAEFMAHGRIVELNDSEISSLVVAGKLPLYALEKQLKNNHRAVVVRRKAIAKLANAPVLDSNKLPHAHYDYDRVFGACCENVIGYMPLPVGVAGPLIIDGTPYHIPMATTEGCLVASTMRGCKAINAGGGVQTILTQDGMTRGPCVSFPTLRRAGACKLWLDSDEGQKTIKKAFNSTSRFARLQHVKTAIAGTQLFIRFKTTTGDAMGMNMISKGVEHSLNLMINEFGWDDMKVIAVSGNYCTDKKPAAINWIEGRGKSVVAEARIPGEVVKKVLKSDVDALVELNISKNLIGSAMAGSVGGFNAHAANLVTAVYLACGQDPAQNVESSNCITLMNKVDDGDLQISVSMPSIEVGTIGGGTILEPQGAMLELLGVRGPHPTDPGSNSRRLACIVASAVLAAELSLCSALAAGHLVQSHMQHNRKAPSAAAPPSASDIKRLEEGSKAVCLK